MQPDPFTERLAKVRTRFASTLDGKISEACEALPHLSGNDAGAIQKLADTYQQIHGLCGVGPTVGFPATGKAARGAEDVLIPAFRAKRALTPEEAEALQTALEALRAAAQSELRSINLIGG